MSCLNSGLILILISVLMTKVNLGNGRLLESKYGLQHGKFSSRIRSHNNLRHGHHFYSWKQKHDPHYYLMPYRSKPRRFTALDKVDDRLDNAAVYFSEKHQKFTTSTPSDIWEDIVTPNSSLFTDNYMSNFINFKHDKKTNLDHMKRRHDTSDRYWDLDKLSYSDLDGENGDSKEYLQDFTTPKPLENHRQDTTRGAKLNLTTLKSSTTTESLSDKTNLLIPRRPFFETSGDESKKIISTTLDPREALMEHLEHVHKEGRCHTPRAKIIKVHEVHPNPSKLYSPSCTILHRCGADTGCCHSLKDVCKPKNITKVELYFYTTIMGQAHKVEKLHFENHTECECRSRTEDMMPRDSSYGKNLGKSTIITSRFGSQGKSNNCTCPSLFSPRYLHNGSCICDCFDKQIDCITRKKGKANFPFYDRLCIKQKNCSQPSCEFGIYNASNGRCPKRNEKIHHSRYRPYVSHVGII